MSALGQKQTFALQKVMSALPPKADLIGACGFSAVLQRRPTRRLITKWSANQITLRKVLTLRKVEQQWHDLR